MRRQPKIVGYRASNVVSVDVKKLDQVGPVIDAGLEAGANQLEGVSFGLQDDRAARRRALEMAASDARSKAETLATALGVKLGSIIEATESGAPMVRPLQMGAEVMMARADVSTPVSPGQIQVAANVSVRYEIAR